MTNDELLHKWLNRTITEEELKIFQKRPEFEELSRLYQQTSHLDAPRFDGDGTLRKILKDKEAQPGPKEARRISMYRFISIGVAASLLLIAGWFLFGPEGVTTVSTAVAERVTGNFPDNSTYVLNAASSLAFSQDTWGEKREITLHGEAFFDVEKGVDFVVNTSEGMVRVLGTQFNVRARDNQLEVKCQSGKVAVLSGSGQEMGVLTTKDALRIEGEEVLTQWTFDGTAAASWTTGVFRFKKVPLSVVLDELERQFSVKIIRQGIDETQMMSCNFEAGNLDLALKTTISVLGIEYRIAGKEVFLKKE